MYHAVPPRFAYRQYSSSVTVPLLRPTADTTALVSSAVAGLRAIFKPGYRYAKTGVMLVELQPAALEQGELDLCEPGALDDLRLDRSKLMAAVDSVNRRYGRGAIGVASAGLEGERRGFSMRQERRTPRYTTNWLEMPIERG